MLPSFLRPVLLATVSSIAWASGGSASDVQFDRTRLWVEAGAATGLADSGQTRFCFSVGGGWYPKSWLGVGFGLGLTDVFASPEFYGLSYDIRSIPVFAEFEVIPWRKGPFNVWCSADIGLAWWWTSYAASGQLWSTNRAYRGAYLAMSIGARHRFPASKVGMFSRVKYSPEVGPELAWPLFSVTIGIEG